MILSAGMACWGKGGDTTKFVTQFLPHRSYDESEEQNRKNEPNLLEISFIFISFLKGIKFLARGTISHAVLCCSVRSSDKDQTDSRIIAVFLT